MQGEPFGRYRLLRRLAFGGMAEIFLAVLHRDQGFEKRVVLKRILPQFSADPSFVQMFIDEAVVAARISHPNIVQVYDFGNVEGIYFIAMEYVDGVDLRRVLANDAGLTGAQVAAIGEGVARALAHAHNLADDAGAPLNIVHRDVSPHNIMLSRAGEAKLMDFGIAKAEARVSKTATGTIKGKVAYMAPEQAAGNIVDKRSDQFALGLVLWECVTGERMFAGDSDLVVLQKVVRCEVRDLCETVPGTPHALADVIMRCLAAEPSARYADLAEAAEALAAFRFSLGTGGAVQLGDLVPVAPAPEPAVGRHTRALPEEPAADSMGEGGWGEAATDAATTPAPARPDTGLTLAVAVNTGSTPVEPATAVSSPVVSGSSVDPATPTRRRWWAALAAAVAVAVGAFVWQQVGSTRVVDATVAQVEVTSAPMGARVLLEGRDTGLHTPATLPGQQRGQSLRLDLLLDGYEPWHTLVTPSGPVERVAATLLQVEASSAAPEVTVAVPNAVAAADIVVAADAVATERRPSKKKRRKKSEATGRLSLRSTGAWVDVSLRGRKLGTTPLTSVEVPAGKLRLRLVNRGAGIDQELEVRVQPDAELRRTVTPRP